MFIGIVTTKTMQFPKWGCIGVIMTIYYGNNKKIGAERQCHLCCQMGSQNAPLLMNYCLELLLQDYFVVCL